MLRKENIEQTELLQLWKKRINGKRVSLQGKFVFSTQEVLEVAKEAERRVMEKATRTRRRKKPTGVKIEEQVDEPLENTLSVYDSDCIIVAGR